MDNNIPKNIDQINSQGSQVSTSSVVTTTDGQNLSLDTIQIQSFITSSIAELTAAGINTNKVAYDIPGQMVVTETAPGVQPTNVNQPTLDCFALGTKTPLDPNNPINITLFGPTGYGGVGGVAICNAGTKGPIECIPSIGLVKCVVGGVLGCDTEGYLLCLLSLTIHPVETAGTDVIQCYQSDFGQFCFDTWRCYTNNTDNYLDCNFGTDDTLCLQSWDPRINCNT